MASATIELNCPGCGTSLVLDAGFAGGVCRCSTCGTLMTVPADPEAKAPERLHRPESPDAPAERPATPGEASPAEQAPSEQEGVTTYTTDTGETIRVDERKIPMAAMKRKAAKWGTIAAFVAVMGVLVAVSVLAIVILSGPDEQQTRDRITDAFGYDPDANPFTAEDANLLGLPLTPRDAVILDASASREPWVSLAGENLANALGKRKDGDRVAALFATAAGPRWLTPEGRLTPVGDLDLTAIEERAINQDSSGRADLTATVEAALSAKPDRILLVLGRTLGEDEDRGIRAALGDSSVEVDVILVGLGMVATPLVEELTEDFDGRAIEVPVQKLAQWWRDRP
jgi:uncharacterized Zn finger protein (UPF0148 family)